MADRGGKKESTDGHGPLESAQSTLTDEEAPLDPPTVGPRAPPVEPPVEPPVPRGSSKGKLPQVGPRKEVTGQGPRLSKADVPREPSGQGPRLSKVEVPKEPSGKGPRLSKSDLPAVNQKSKSGLAQVKPRLSKQIPAVQDPGSEPATDSRPALNDDARGAKTDERPGLSDSTAQKTELRAPLSEAMAGPRAAESPTTLRPSLGQGDAPTGPNRPLHELGTTPGHRGPALDESTDKRAVPRAEEEIVESSTDRRPRPDAEALQDNPALSTLGYRSLRYKEKGPRLLDKQTTLILAAAVAGTFVLGAILWKVASPAPPPPDPSVLAPLPRSIADAAKPAPPPEKPQVADAPKKPEGIFLEEQVDAGNGYVKTVKIEAGTLLILSDPEVVISRNGQELGRTPLTITLPVGNIALQVANREQGLSRTMNLEVGPGQNPSKRWTFIRGRIEVRAPNGTTVTIDGRAVGRAPLSPVPLWPGLHTVEVAFPRGGTDKRRVDVDPGETHPVDFEAPVYDSKLAQ